MKVLVAYDGSDCSQRAVKHALQMAKCNSEMKVTIIAVAYIAELTIYHDFVSNRDEIINEYKKRTMESLEQAKVVFDDAGIAVELSMLIGEPAESIVNTVNEQGFELVIMGTRGLSGFKGLFLGSISSKVIANVDVPVTVVK